MSNRTISVVAAFLMLGGFWACWSDLSMIWDGAYQFCRTLIEQRAYFHETRFHSWVLWQPVLWLDSVSDDLGSLRFVYGLPFCMAPALGFILSWWVTRRHAPHLLLWAAFGTAAAMLPGQVFIINDSIFQLHLFWPLFLGLMTPLGTPQRIVLTALALFQLSHPIGMVLSGGAAIVLALLAYEAEGTGRRTFSYRSAMMALLAIVAFLKVFLFPDPYAASEFTFWAAVACWKQGVAGLPLAGWLCMAAAGGLLHIAGKLDPARRMKFTGVALICALVGSLLWLYWASEPARWAKALDYRRFVVPFTVPFLVLAWLEMRARGTWDDHRVGHLRNSVACVLGAVFAAVMAIHSTQWQSMNKRLFQELANGPGIIVDPGSLPWLQETALNHWSVTALPIANGITGKFLVAAGQEELLYAVPPRVSLSYFKTYPPEPGEGGWFDFREAVASLKEERPAGVAAEKAGAQAAVISAGPDSLLPGDSGEAK